MLDRISAILQTKTYLHVEIAGYIASIFIGISLGLIGGGGSILTVPVLVYLFAVDAVVATTYSLFIVGIASSIGSLSYFKKKLVSFRTAFVFGVPSILAVYLTRTFLLPAIPKQIFTVGEFTLTKNILLMLLFAVLMVFASYSMIKKANGNKNEEGMNKEKDYNYPLVVAQGFFTGLITGLIGAGGGFLIIPALVNFLKMPMKNAVGTSLVIIALNSLLGFLFSINQISIDWQLVLTVSSIAIVGILLGSFLSTKIDGKKLKPGFGWFVLIMGLYIILKETLLK